MTRYDAAVVGAGASGLMAALTAAQSGLRVALLEGGGKPGRKLAATGNGRCNLTNENLSTQFYHGDVDLAAPLLAAWPAQRVRDHFAALGLLTRVDGQGRVYPYSLQAAAVVQALAGGVVRAGVEPYYSFLTVQIKPAAGGFLLSGADGRQVFARHCVLACGGGASPKLSAGSGYDLAKSLDHTVTPLSPSLVGLAVSGKLARNLKGMRCRARASLVHGRKEVYAESGEVIFGDGSLSGICIMNLSARLRGLRSGRVSLHLDLAEDFSLPELMAYFEARCGNDPAASAWELFSGLLNLRVGQELSACLGFDRELPLSGLSEKQLFRAARTIKDLSLLVAGSLGWETAQCTAGGVPLAQVDLATMESRKTPGLYLTGELLDLDGDCGGYNLHWAWVTGITAGQALCR